LNSKFARVACGVLILLCFVSSLHATDHSKALEPRYRHWLNEEVNYIIASDERKHFLSLTSDAERDSFIESFWKIRNPDPGSSSNSYKDEHYRRLTYANEHFGSVAAHDGWRTDQGRIYIVLGPPKEIEVYPAAHNVRPIEIWFYQSPTPALPAYFNVVFFQRSVGEPYSLYSPTADGPAHLVTTLEALNDDKKSLAIVEKSLGEAVAKTVVSLIPGDSVSLDDYRPSMTSDMLLSNIASLPDNPITKERIEANRVRERVTMSVFTGGDDSTVNYDSFRDDRGRMTLSYLLSKQFADPHLVGTRKDGSTYYDLTLRTNVLTAGGKPVYAQEDLLTGNLTPAQAEVARKKRFCAEARLPLVPGNYIVVTTLTNRVDGTASRQRSSVTVPAIKSQGIALSGLLAYTTPAAVPDPKDELPFSGSHFRFTPRGAQNVYISQGERLPVVFQLWLNPKSAETPAPQKIHLHYVFGSVAVSHDEATQENEDVDAENRDDAGNLLTGHTLDTSSLPPGAYQVVVGATPEGEQRTAYATLNLHVAPAADYVGTWTAYGSADPGGEALDDLKRGLSAEAQGADADAEAAYGRALAESPGYMRPLDNLAALLAREGATDRLAALSKLPILEKTAASPGTLLLIAQALDKNGNPKAIVKMLEAQIALQPPSVDLYTVLADACQATGNKNRADELRNLAANLKK
jgi:GWxTD domain-containing protein